MTTPPDSPPSPSTPSRRFGGRLAFLLTILVTAALTFVVAYLLVSIFRHKTEAANPYLRFVEVTEDTTDPKPWGVNWPREYDQYQKTVLPTKTNFGGGDAIQTAEKAGLFPFLTRMFAGYAFSIDYRDRRGHAYMLLDQEKTRRVTERPQPGACLHCHASVIPTYRRLGEGDVQQGFVKLSAMSYQDAHAEVAKTGSINMVPTGTAQEKQHVEGAHPVSCVDCHDPKTMQLRVTRPGFITGIKALAAGNGPVLPGSSIETWRQGNRQTPYDPNRDATRQEMRSFVCGQCHVEYYCGPKVTLFFPWNNGLKVEEIESHYDSYKFPDGHRFYDWTHAETGAELLKAQHPETELFNQGIHARSGVACADCHMPYVRQGAMKVSDHWVRSPLLMVNNSCQQCHQWPETELQARVGAIQQRNFQLLQRSGKALTDMLDAVKVVRAPFNDANRASAETEAKEKLAKNAAYARLSPEEQAKKLQQTTAETLNARWAARVAADPALKDIAELHRKAQWRLDFVAAENSMGFHAPQETARILGESIDYFRQAQVLAQKLAPAGSPATAPATGAATTTH